MSPWTYNLKMWCKVRRFVLKVTLIAIRCNIGSVTHYLQHSAVQNVYIDECIDIYVYRQIGQFFKDILYTFIKISKNEI